MQKITWKDIFERSKDGPASSSPQERPHNTPINVPVRPAQNTTVPTVAEVTKSPDDTQQTEMPKTNFITPVAPPPTPMRPVQSVVVEDPTSSVNSDSLFLIGSSHDVCQDYVSNKNSGIKS